MNITRLHDATTANFTNVSYILDDLRFLWQHHDSHSPSVLNIGISTGLEPLILRNCGYNLTTVDVVPSNNPDILLDIRKLSLISGEQYDISILSHVAEHIEYSAFPTLLADLSSLSKYTILYLPVAGKHYSFRIHSERPFFSLDLVVDISNPFRYPSDTTPRFCDGQHFWEIGPFCIPLRKLRRQISKSHRILKEYRNLDWIPSYNFVLKRL